MPRARKRIDTADRKFERNPFAPASKTEKKIKLLLWGDAGSGKTRLSLQFPKPVVIDMERGTDFYGEEFDFDVRHMTDANDVAAAVEWLQNNEHDYETLVIDPITIYWEALQTKWSNIFLKRHPNSKGHKDEFYEFQVKDWIIIKQEFKELCRRLIDLDMHVIVTARQKTKYAESGFMQAIGETFDGEKSLPYLFDTIVRMWKSKDKFIGMMVKDRTNSLSEKPFKANFKIFRQAFGIGKEGKKTLRGKKRSK